jgi:hypothetical protein
MLISSEIHHLSWWFHYLWRKWWIRVSLINFCWNYVPWLICDIDKLGLGFIVLFNRLSCGDGILCFYGSIIINIDNGITYNWKNNEFLTTTLDMSLIEKSRLLCDRIGWNLFEIKVEIT